jgi:hypothetical protein
MEAKMTVTEQINSAIKDAGGNIRDALNIALAKQPTEIYANPVCEWVEDADGCYETTCAHEFYFDGGMSDDFIFCPFCGKSIINEPYSED